MLSNGTNFRVHIDTKNHEHQSLVVRDQNIDDR